MCHRLILGVAGPCVSTRELGSGARNSGRSRSGTNSVVYTQLLSATHLPFCVLETSAMELNASCDICGHLLREPPRARSVIASATFPDFANQAAHGCTICALICTTVTQFISWGSVAQDKVFISIHEVYAPNKNIKEVEVRGYELIKPCPPDQRYWLGNSRDLFCAVLYSPLGKAMRRHPVTTVTTNTLPD